MATIPPDYRPGAARPLDPFRRLSYHVLLTAVEDARRGRAFTPDEFEDLRPWCDVARIDPGDLRRTLRLAAAGRLPALRLSSFNWEAGLGPRVESFRAAHAAG